MLVVFPASTMAASARLLTDEHLQAIRLSILKTCEALLVLEPEGAVDDFDLTLRINMTWWRGHILPLAEYGFAVSSEIRHRPHLRFDNSDTWDATLKHWQLSAAEDMDEEEMQFPSWMQVYTHQVHSLEYLASLDMHYAERHNVEPCVFPFEADVYG